MYRIVVNLQTGEQESIPLTAEEIAEIEARPQPEPEIPPTAEQKLQRVGLTPQDLVALLEVAADVTIADIKKAAALARNDVPA